MITDVMVDTEFLSFSYDSYILSTGVAHDALMDAIVQAEQVHTAWKWRTIRL